MATSKRCAKLVSLIFILKNAIYLFITTEIVELFLYITKSGGLVVKMQRSKHCHYVVSRQTRNFTLLRFSPPSLIPCDVIASDPIKTGISSTSGHFMIT